MQPSTSFAQDFLGNEDAIARLLQPNLPQTLLFSGPEGVGKATLAKRLAAATVKPSDIRLLETEKLHSIESIRELIKDLALPPYESQAKYILIDDADKMLPYAANALLKTLEEPPAYSRIILISSHSDRLLPTILSRCTLIPFHPLKPSQILSHVQDPTIARLCRGSLSRAQKLLSGELDIDSIIAYLTNTGPLPDADPNELIPLIATWYRDLHAIQAGSEHIFFQDQFPALQARLMSPIPSLEQIHYILFRAQDATSRGIKLKNALVF